jgi:hypothetical protein
MDADRQRDYARAVWQEQPPELSLAEIADRAAFLRRSFGASAHVPWLVTAILVVCFVVILANSETGMQRAGSWLGLGAAVYFITAAVRLLRRPMDEEAPCLRAYADELRRQRDALRICAITIVMVMTGAALASVSGDNTGWKRFIGPSSTLLTGIGVAAYIDARARRYARRATEVERLETHPE